MISIRKHMEWLTREDASRRALLGLLDGVLNIVKANILVMDPDEHAQFCQQIRSLQERLEQDASPTNVEVVAALLSRTLKDHWTRLARLVHLREQEMKSIINLLAEGAAQLDRENRGFYERLRAAVRAFEDISQLEDITFIRRKLAEQVGEMQKNVARQQQDSEARVQGLQSQLEDAHRHIERLTRTVTEDSLTGFPGRQAGERVIRDIIEHRQPVTVAMAVVQGMVVITQRYGAEFGDDVLQRFAQQLRQALPPEMFLCRWGGPAFVAVVERLAAEETKGLLQRALGAIGGRPIEIVARGGGLITINSKFAVQQWVGEQNVDRVFRQVDAFCTS